MGRRMRELDRYAGIEPDASSRGGGGIMLVSNPLLSERQRHRAWMGSSQCMRWTQLKLQAADLHANCLIPFLYMYKLFVHLIHVCCWVLCL